MVNAPGKNLLKVTGILFIVFGGISAVMSLLAILESAVLSAVSAELGGVALVASIISLIGAGLNIVVGIMGVANAAKPEKAQICFILGIVLIAVQGLSLILSIVGSTFGVTGLIGFALPILFLIGTYQNKQAAAQGNSQQ